MMSLHFYRIHSFLNPDRFFFERLKTVYFPASLSFGKITFSKIAAIVVTTTGDFPNTVVTHAGSCASASEHCVIPIPSATESPTIEVLR